MVNAILECSDWGKSPDPASARTSGWKHSTPLIIQTSTCLGVVALVVGLFCWNLGTDFQEVHQGTSPRHGRLSTSSPRSLGILEVSEKKPDELQAKKTNDSSVGQVWKDMLLSPKGNSWFTQWNIPIQAKIDELSRIAEAEESTKSEPFKIQMIGDSTMQHQFGAVCAFLAERPGRRFNPEESQTGSTGCCVDTKEEHGGGRGLCFIFNRSRFLNPVYAAKDQVDAYYFGCGLHLLHVAPEKPLEALRTQQWLAYEHLLEDTVTAVRDTNGPDVRIAFMVTHIVADERFLGAFAKIRDAYRLAPGNETIREKCDQQIDEVVKANPTDNSCHGCDILLKDYPRGEGDFTPEVYCNEGLLDRHGSVQLGRRGRHAMARVGVPLVDAGQIVEGQSWATGTQDGRHFRPLVPLELYTMLGAITSPPPPPSDPIYPVGLEKSVHEGAGTIATELEDSAVDEGNE